MEEELHEGATTRYISYLIDRLHRGGGNTYTLHTEESRRDYKVEQLPA